MPCKDREISRTNAAWEHESALTQWVWTIRRLPQELLILNTFTRRHYAGDPAISLDYMGSHYRFVNVGAKKMFEADPAKYTIAYKGYCAMAKEMFDAGATEVVKKADAQWVSLN